MLTRLIWGAVAQSRLDTRIAAIRAAGEPIDFHDLVPRQPATLPPDDRNAAYHLRQGLELWPRIDGRLIIETRWYHETDEQRLTNATADPVADDARYLADAAPAIEALHRAADAPDCHWGKVIRPWPDMMASMPDFAIFRQWSRMLADASTRAVRIGDHTLAVELAMLNYRLARHAVESFPSMLSAHVELNCLTASVSMLEITLPSIRPDSRSDRLVLSLRETRDRLLNDAPRRQSRRAVLLGERWLMRQSLEAKSQGLLPKEYDNSHSPLKGRSAVERWIMYPIHADNTTATLEYITSLLSCFEQSDNFVKLQELRRADPAQVRLHQGWENWYWATAWTAPFLIDSLASGTYKSEARLRLAGAAVALKLYELDHGRAAQTLDELTPDYLPRPPADPFAADGRPIGYRPDGAVATMNSPDSTQSDEAARIARGMPRLRVLYSVGRDGMDHRGTFIYHRSSGVIDWFGDDPGTDLIFLLEPAPVAKPASSSASASDESAP